MAKAVISYDKDLPEVPDRLAHLRPDCHLIKKTAEEYEIVDGRRPSKMLLVNRLREAVDNWRNGGYPGASSVTQRLFQFWFEEDHILNGSTFKYYFGQREAVETVVYLFEIQKNHDLKPLINSFAEAFKKDMFTYSIEHQTTMDGGRQIRRYFPELDSDGLQDLPPENLRRYAFKMATGSGKTYVMAMVMVWSYFHRKMVRGSDLSTNFLIVAPNVIVYQRLEKDFASNKIFYDLPLIPPEWQWNMKVILRGESTEPDPSGNLFLTNIQQIYESRDQEWTPSNAVDAILGRKPVKDIASYQRSMLERIKTLRDLVVMNDEAHHVHDEELVWYKTLMAIHESIPNGLALWLDFSATPKDQNGTYYPWIICDYPLAQAVEDRIVKAPLIVHQVKRADPEKITKENVTDEYGEWLLAALERWKDHYKTYKALGPKPVLFIMAEKNAFADELGKWLVDKTNRTGLKESEVLIIHTDSEGEITKADVEKAREVARDIDLPTNKTKVIVSVMMLREGWDVKNVSVVLGLRPFTSKAKILPEQAVGRGLRLMENISPDRTQTLEVLGTKAFEDFVRQLEMEGVGIKTVTKPPAPPIKIEPVQEKIKYDIAIPLTRPVYLHDYKKLSSIDPLSLDPIYDSEELEEEFRISLRMEFATTETEVHRAIIIPGTPPLSQEILSSITNKVIAEAKLSNVFADLYPIVRTYVENKCFGQKIDLENEHIRNHLRTPMLQQGIAKYLGRKISELTSEKREIEFEEVEFKLSDTQPFVWRRRHLQCDHTIFNYVATYNDFESEFAKFLDRCTDILRFAALAEHFTRFRVDYLSPSGAIKFYYPDFVAVQKGKNGKQISWIIETKGQVYEAVAHKEVSIIDWCKKVSTQIGEEWHYIRVDQKVFGDGKFKTFSDLIQTIEGKATTQKEIKF
jgi:type III restriction enzyme